MLICVNYILKAIIAVTAILCFSFAKSKIRLFLSLLNKFLSNSLREFYIFSVVVDNFFNLRYAFRGRNLARYIIFVITIM